MDFNTNSIFARGTTDSSGKSIGLPVFTESGVAFKAEHMTYDFSSQKGIIKNVTTEDAEGYLYGEKVYILLSLTAKALLSWQVFFPVLLSS